MKRRRTIKVKSRMEYSVEDEGYRDGYSDGIRRVKRQRPGRLDWLLFPTLNRRLRRAKWEAYGRGYDDGTEQAGQTRRLYLIDDSKEGTGAV